MGLLLKLDGAGCSRRFHAEAEREVPEACSEFDIALSLTKAVR